MPGPLLIVELPTADTTVPEAAALVRACSQGLGSGRCELSSQSAKPAAAVAVVSLRGPDAIGALIEVGSRRHESRSWRTQEVVFQPQDERLERFRTLGFAIATLFRETQIEPAQEEGATGEPRRPSSGAARKEAAESKTNAEASSAAARPNTLPFTRYPLGWLTVGALAAYDDDLPASWRLGGRLALGVAPFELPLFASLSGSYAAGEVPATSEQPEISLSWATVALGAGAYFSLPSDLSARIGVQGVLVDLAAHATEGDRREESQRWVRGGQLTLELVGLSSRRWGFAAGGELQQLSGGTAIVVHNRDAALVGAFSWTIHAAFELRPFQR
jgi:hypothetical protein